MLPLSPSALRDSVLNTTAVAYSNYPLIATLLSLYGAWSIYRTGIVFLKFVGSFIFTGGNARSFFIVQFLHSLHSLDSSIHQAWIVGRYAYSCFTLRAKLLFSCHRRDRWYRSRVCSTAGPKRM